MIRRARYAEVASLREQHRRAATCQIVRDSILSRGLADAWAIVIAGRVEGYAGVWNTHFDNRLMEFHVAPLLRGHTATIFRDVLEVTDAHQIEAQTNMPLMFEMLQRYTARRWVENLLFDEGPPTQLHVEGAAVRRRRQDDVGPGGEWVVELHGRVVGGGGALTHYNPPYADLFFAVSEDARGRGIGSYLVQELRRIVRERGFVPAARCDADNQASRRTLLRGGMRECGHLLAGDVPRAPGSE